MFFFILSIFVSVLFITLLKRFLARFLSSCNDLITLLFLYISSSLAFVVFYFLKDNNLERVDLETILDTDGQCEITIKHLYTDEGGN